MKNAVAQRRSKKRRNWAGNYVIREIIYNTNAQLCSSLSRLSIIILNILTHAILLDYCCDRDVPLEDNWRQIERD